MENDDSASILFSISSSHALTSLVESDTFSVVLRKM